jgi:hypothetical protein
LSHVALEAERSDLATDFATAALPRCDPVRVVLAGARGHRPTQVVRPTDCLPY